MKRCGALKVAAALGVLSIFAGASIGVAQADTLGQQIASQAEIGDAVPVAGIDILSTSSDKLAGGVTVLADLTYQTLIGYRPMKLDLYLPPASFDQGQPRPWVVYIHGGGWVEGGPRRIGAFADWPKVMASLAARGYVVAAVSYRFAREATSPAAIQDVKAAIRWLRVGARKYHLDPQRGMTWGVSAGGQLATLAAVSCGVAAFEPPACSVPDMPDVETSASSPKGADEVSDCVQGAVSWYGVYDFATAYKSSGESPLPNVTELYLGCHTGPCTASQLREASPIIYVDAKDPPMLLIHGTEDQTVNPAQGQEFQAALQAAGVQSRLVMIPGVGHSFIGKAPEATHRASKQALQQSIDFIEATIGDSAARK